jgi:hypothetical protein
MDTIWHIPDGFATLLLALATLLAGSFVIIGAWIAWRSVQRQIRSLEQMEASRRANEMAIQNEKIRMDLYNRRFEIFVSIFAFYEAMISWKGTPEQIAARNKFSLGRI